MKSQTNKIDFDTLLKCVAKRCPFCNASQFNLHFVSGEADESVCVGCKKCGARGPWSKGSEIRDSKCANALKLWGEEGKPRFFEGSSLDDSISESQLRKFDSQSSNENG